MKKILTFSLSVIFLKVGTAQNVGIGLNNPQTALHVAERKDVLFGANLTGGGTKLLWLGSLGAFRAGVLYDIYVNAWNVQNVGMHSFATGRNINAITDYDFAFGLNVSTGGAYAIGMGRGVNASTDYSLAIGQNTITSGVHAIALGQNANASSNRAMALGASSKAEASAVAIGYNAQASMYRGLAVGGDSRALGYQGAAIGNGA